MRRKNLIRSGYDLYITPVEAIVLPVYVARWSRHEIIQVFFLWRMVNETLLSSLSLL